MNDINEKYEKLLQTGDLLSKANQEKLSDKESDKLMDGLSELNDDNIDDDFLENYIPNEEDMDLEKNPQTVDVMIDPYTGKINNVVSNTKYNTSDANLDRLLSMTEDEIKTNVDLSEESVQNSIQSLFPEFELTDFKAFMSALERYRKGEKFSYYNALPESLQKQINYILGTVEIGYTSAREARNYVVQGIFDQVIQENYTNAMFVDLNKSLEESYKELYDDTKGQFSAYNNNQRHMIEDKFLEEADRIEKEEPEKAKSLREMSRMFKESYTYEEMYKLYENTGKLKVKQIEIDKFKRTCTEWCSKYKDNKFIINNVYDIYPVIQNVFEGYDFDDDVIKKFVVVFIKYTRNMDPNNIAEHMFMFYFIKNILLLKFHNEEDEKEVEFCNDVKNNIHKFLTLITEKDAKEAIKNVKKNNKKDS